MVCRLICRCSLKLSLKSLFLQKNGKQKTIEAIEKAAYTGEPGDGKILRMRFVMLKKIRTKETGYDAIQATE